MYLTWDFPAVIQQYTFFGIFSMLVNFVNRFLVFFDVLVELFCGEVERIVQLLLQLLDGFVVFLKGLLSHQNYINFEENQ